MLADEAGDVGLAVVHARFVGGGALLASSSSAAGVIVRVEAAILTTTSEQGGRARWRGGGACHPLRTILLVERGGKTKTK